MLLNFKEYSNDRCQCLVVFTHDPSFEDKNNVIFIKRNGKSMFDFQIMDYNYQNGVFVRYGWRDENGNKTDMSEASQFAVGDINDISGAIIHPTRKKITDVLDLYSRGRPNEY